MDNATANSSARKQQARISLFNLASCGAPLPRLDRMVPPNLDLACALDTKSAFSWMVGDIDKRPDRADCRRPPDAGRRMEEAGIGRRF